MNPMQTTRRLCVIPGDGIGPEVTESAVEVLRAAVPHLEVEQAGAGWRVFEQTGSSVDSATMELVQDCGAALFGAVQSPLKKVNGYESAILKIRQELGLFANIRPIQSVFADSSERSVSLVIVRENTEGLYVRRERMEGSRAIAERVISRKASKRIGATALEVAWSFGFNRITCVHKANVLPVSDGLFRDSVFETIRVESELHAAPIELDQALVDIAAFRLVESPEDFQIIVTTNLYGDILSDLAAYWCGGMGRAPSLNLGNGIAVAEPVHGSAPDLVGTGTADPTAAILSAALLCRLHWREFEVAEQIELAVQKSRRLCQESMDWSPTTSEYTDIVLRQLEQIQNVAVGAK